MDNEAQLYLEEMEKKRGYLLPSHKLLAEYDLAYLKNYNILFEGVMEEKENDLSNKEKEFVFIGINIALGNDKKVVAGHIKRAFNAGATTDEILRVIQLATLSFLSKSLILGTSALSETLDQK